MRNNFQGTFTRFISLDSWNNADFIDKDNEGPRKLSDLFRIQGCIAGRRFSKCVL